MIINQNLNLVYLVQYEVKTYLVDKDISNREKMRTKTYIDFMISYDSTNI